MTMENKHKNPFQELYLTEAIEDPELYWNWFSPAIITGQTEALYRPGNSILIGSNGAGKTMLLRLFSPQVQAAYLRHNVDLPIGNDPLIGLSINFVHAGFGSLGQRRVDGDPEANQTQWALLAGDLLNYHLLNELVETLLFLKEPAAHQLAEHLGARITDDSLNSFAAWISSRDCWFGALADCLTFNKLKMKVRERLSTFRSFVNWNRAELPNWLLETKTAPALPLIEASTGLALHNLLPATTPLIVAVDQYETLLHIDYEREPDPDRSLGHLLCRVVNTFLAARNPKVSYKVGVRPYAWGRELRLFGSDARVELGRDYQPVDLDEVLRRPENITAWVFPRFAADVAERRLAMLPGASVERPRRFADRLETLSPDDEVEKYCRGEALRALPNMADWPPAWRDFVALIYSQKKLRARLIAVWVFQQLDAGRELPPEPVADDKAAPWNAPWWQKERIEAALTQVASDCRQRKLYGGWQDVLTLSGSNVLIFLSICREIWDLGMRADARTDRRLEKYSPELQSQAIWSVAAAWLNKQDEFPGGSSRRRFVGRLGIGIRKALLADRALVYPGNTGFSVISDDLESPAQSDVRSFLENAADFGSLLKLPHTTKNKDRRRRTKWYLFPILCPNFDIPAIRTKEPYYADILEVRRWLATEMAIEFRGPRAMRRTAENLNATLFGDPE